MKRILSFALSLLLTLPILSSCGGEKWDVSEQGDGSLTAVLKKRDGTLTLVIEGEGGMKDFAPGETPWAESAETIGAVEIGEGALSVGENAFRGLNIPYVLLPDSVKTVKSGAVDEGVKLFSEGDATAEGQEIYYLSEEAPAAEDRYFLQGQSKEDITKGLNSAEKRYFSFEDGIPTPWPFQKVLFIGNSFTYRNGVSETGGGVPKLFDGIAADLGTACETYMIAGPGWHLKDHANAEDDCGKQVDLLLNAVHDFDYIVLQEHSTDSMDKNEDFIGGIKALMEKIAKTQTRAEVVLYETWGSPASAKTRETTVSAMGKELEATYSAAAEACGGLKISHVGRAFTEVYEAHGTDKEYDLWDTDERHQGYLGAYLSACVHVETLLKLDVRDTLYFGEKTPAPSEKVMFDLQEAAEKVVRG